MSLAGLSDLKTLLGIPTSDTSQDDALTLLLEGVDAAVKSYTKRPYLEATEVTEYHSGSGRPELVLRHRPVTAVSAVYLHSRGYFGKGPSAFPAGSLLTEGVDFVGQYDSGVTGAESRSGLLIRLGGPGGMEMPWDCPARAGLRGSLSATLAPYWQKGVGNLKVVYTAGYNPVPADLRQAALQLASWGYLNAAQGGTPITRESFEDYDVRFAEDLDREKELGSTRTLLAPYREPVLF